MLIDLKGIQFYSEKTNKQESSLTEARQTRYREDQQSFEFLNMVESGLNRHVEI